MANKITPEQILEVVEKHMGKESKTYVAVKEALDDGCHPKEVWFWLVSTLRETGREV